MGWEKGVDQREMYMEATSPLDIDPVLRGERRERDLAQSNQNTKALSSSTTFPVLISDLLNFFHHDACYYS